MILVTVGTTESHPFDRLIRAADALAAQIDEPVVMQRGCATYEPQHAEHVRFTDSAEIERLNDEARVVVSHAAAGGAIVALVRGKPIVLVPRRHGLGESVDDHQLELGRALAKQQRAVVVEEPTAETLRQAIELAVDLASAQVEQSPLVGFLRNQLAEWRSDQARVQQGRWWPWQIGKSA